MDIQTLIPIVLAEALLLCIVVIFILSVQLVKLRRMKKKLIDRLKSGGGLPDEFADIDTSDDGKLYETYLDENISSTRAYHQSQNGNPEISLDIDPDAPVIRRTAALRHAILIAEKECFGQEGIENWDLLASRYQNLIQFHEDFPPTEADEGMVAELEDALEAAHKRIANLEKFRQLYFELEEKWSTSKAEADGYYEELKVMGPQGEENKETYEITLQKYHAAYQGLGDFIEQAGDPTEDERVSDTNLVEVARLRQLAAEQNQIIDDLKNELIKIKSDTKNNPVQEQTIQLMEHMEAELQKQARFMSESETCIKLMEEELNACNAELISLRAKVDRMPHMRQQLRAAQDAENHAKQIISTLKQENRRQAQKIKLVSEAAPEEDSGQVKKLRRDLTALQTKYAELEERYLDLKMQ